MKAFALAAAAALMASQAGATVIRYEYQGAEMQPTPQCWEAIGDCSVQSPMTGWVEIDLSKFPESSLGMLKIYNFAWSQDRIVQAITYGSGGIEQSTCIYDPADPEWTCNLEGPEWLDYSMIAAPINFESLTEGADTGYLFSFTLDEAGNVIDWAGAYYANFSDCGYGAQISGPVTKNTCFELMFDTEERYGLPMYASYEPGTWTRTVIPSPVPLPAAAPLLLAGTAALFALRRRSHRVG